jgi:hypothetical protein
MKSLALSLLVTTCALVSESRATGADAGDFDRRIAPILARWCLDCHSGADPKGKLDLSTRRGAARGGAGGPAIADGKPGESAVWERIEADEMPPDAPLSASEKAAIREWIEKGAAWGADPIDPYQVTTARKAGRDWWSLQPLVRPSIPPVRNSAWARGAIDRFVLEKLESRGLAPAPEAERRVLIRRLSFDLTGLPPAPEDVDRFLADRSPDAYERLVERYLASPQYGVRWARWWLDLARYGESNGFEYDEFRPNAWRYRDWVVHSLNRDLPYDEFARLQLAGDVIVPNDTSSIEATGFLVAGAYDTAGQNQISVAMKAVVRGDELEDMIGTVGQTFLGLTINCARCHDHKFDPIRQTEYYRVASALAGVRHGERDLAELDSDTQRIRQRIESLTARLAAIEAPARARLGGAAKNIAAPAALAVWDFDRGLDDRVGKLHARAMGTATISANGLQLDGKTGFAVSAPLERELSVKTIEAWVLLDRLDQQGGAVISVETRGGGAFDAIVFGEREPGRWMAGSEGFARYQPVGGATETQAAHRPVHVAATFDANGQIQLFRDGRPYGKPYRGPGPVVFPRGETEVLFGLRHGTPGGNRMLAGTIVRARLYDRALSAAEVAASAAAAGEFITPEAIAGALTEAARRDRQALIEQIARLRMTADTPRRAYVVTPRPPAAATRVEIRGNPGQPGDVVAPGGIASIVGSHADFGLPADSPESERRIKLARWVADQANPLFSRVIVNRLWQAHFGAGLVESPSDFGFNGGKPSHPELLDWLANVLIDAGFSLKSMHRLIVTSASYRESSRIDPAARKVDAGDRLLWRKAPVRLEAEMVRDAILAVSGKIELSLAGPSFRDYEVVQSVGTPAVLYSPVDPAKPGLNRRTLYRAWARGGRSSLLDIFDCPDPSTTAPRRAVTTTPLQALSLLNNALVLYHSEAAADRLAREAGPDVETQVDRAYRLALCRPPEPAERDAAARIVREYGLRTLARVIFNCNEFLYID